MPWNIDSREKLIAGDRVYRYVLVGQDRGFDVTDLQPMTIVSINRKTITVRTDEGNIIHLPPQDICGRFVDD